MFKYAKNSKSKLTKARRSSKIVAAGVECVYIQMNKNTAYKCYHTKREATDAIRRQKLAYRHDIAPKVLSPVVYYNAPNIEHELYDGGYCNPSDVHTPKRGWAYKTEVVKTHDADDISLDRDMIAELEAKAQDAGFGIGDLHDWNIGLLGDKYVMIDFGDVSSNVSEDGYDSY
jgi:hypothetical protein